MTAYTPQQYLEAARLARQSGDDAAAAELEALAKQAAGEGRDIELPPPAAERVGETIADVGLPIAGAALGSAVGAALAPIAPVAAPLAVGAGLLGGHMAGGRSLPAAAGNTILDLVGGRVLEPVARMVAPAIGKAAEAVGRTAGRATYAAGKGAAEGLRRLYTDAGRLAGDMSDTGDRVVSRLVEEAVAGQPVRAPTATERRAMAEAFERRTGARYRPGPYGEYAEAVAANLPATARYVERIHSQRQQELEAMADRLFGKAADPEEVGDAVAQWAADTSRELLKRENEIWEQVAEKLPDNAETRQRIAAGLRRAVGSADPSGRLAVVHPLVQSREAVNARQVIQDIAAKLEAGEELGTRAPVFLDQLRRDIDARAREILERNPGSERARRLKALSSELRSVQRSLLPDDVASRWDAISQDYARVRQAVDTLGRYMPDAATGELPDSARRLLDDLARRRSLWRAASRLAEEAGDEEPLRQIGAAVIADRLAKSPNTRAFVRELNKLHRDIRSRLPLDQLETAMLYSAFREVASRPARMAVTPGGGHGRTVLGAVAFGLANALGAAGTAMLRAAEREALESALSRGRLPTLTDEARIALRQWAVDVLRYGGADAARQALARQIVGTAEAADVPASPRPTADTTDSRPVSVLDLMPEREPIQGRRVSTPPPPRRQQAEYPQPRLTTTEGPVSVLDLIGGR